MEGPSSSPEAQASRKLIEDATFNKIFQEPEGNADLQRFEISRPGRFPGSKNHFFSAIFVMWTAQQHAKHGAGDLARQVTELLLKILELEGFYRPTVEVRELHPRSIRDSGPDESLNSSLEEFGRKHFQMIPSSLKGT